MIKDITDYKVGVLADITRKASQDPEIRNLASSIVRTLGKPNRDQLSEVKTIFGYVRKKVRFVPEPFEVFYYPTVTLKMGKADCEDMSTTLGSMLKSLGYPVYFKVVDVSGQGYTHIYPLCGIRTPAGERFIALDATLRRPMASEPDRIYRYRLFEI